MTMPDVSGLPENLDATYADDPDNPTRKQHQQHHDTVHAAVKALLPRAEASATYQTIASLTEAVQDIVGAQVVAGANISVTYNDTAGTITIEGTGGGGGSTDPEVVRDTIATALVAGTNMAVTVNDAADTITLSTTATVNSTDAALRDRSTHTGSQPISTVTGLQTALDAKLASADAPELIRDTIGTALVAGSNVTITPNDAGDSITIAAAAGGGGGGSGLPVLTRSGFWQPSAFHLDSTPSGQAWPIINRIYFTPHYIPAGTAITAISHNVTGAGGAGVVIRLALMTDNAGRPGTVIEQGTVAGDSTGAKTLTLATPYTSPGVFWIACGPQGSGSAGSFWGAPVLGLPTGDNGASWSAIFGSSPLRFDTASPLTSNPALDVDAGALSRFPYTVVRVQ